MEDVTKFVIGCFGMIGTFVSSIAESILLSGIILKPNLGQT